MTERISAKLFQRTKVRETDILKACLDICLRIGFVVFRTNTGVAKYTHKLKNGTTKDSFVRFNEPGYPDIAGYIPERIELARRKRIDENTTHAGAIALYIEVKRPGGKLTNFQKTFLDNAKGNGCFSIVAYGADDLISNLKLLRYI